MLARRAVAGTAAVGVLVVAVDADAREEVVGSVRLVANCGSAVCQAVQVVSCGARANAQCLVLHCLQ